MSKFVAAILAAVVTAGTTAEIGKRGLFTKF